MRYQPMSPADFTSALEEAGMSCADFARVANQPGDRITRMMFGMEKVTYEVSLLATVLTVPAARELALMHAEMAETETPYRQPEWSPDFMIPGGPA